MKGHTSDKSPGYPRHWLPVLFVKEHNCATTHAKSGRYNSSKIIIMVAPLPVPLRPQQRLPGYRYRGHRGRSRDQIRGERRAVDPYIAPDARRWGMARIASWDSHMSRSSVLASASTPFFRTNFPARVCRYPVTSYRKRFLFALTSRFPACLSLASSVYLRITSEQAERGDPNRWQIRTRRRFS